MNRTYGKIIFPALLALCTWSACSTTRTVDTSRANPEAEPMNEVAVENGASYYTEIDYHAGSTRLQPEDYKAISELVQKSMREGKIDEIKIISWADQEYPSEGRGKLSADQKKIAESRNNSIKRYLKETYPSLEVKAYNMASRPGKIQELFKTSDASTKKSFEDAGVIAQEQTGVEPKIVSKSVLFSVIKRNY